MKETLYIQKRQEVLSLITNVAFANVPCWYDASRRDLRADLIVPKVRQGLAPRPAVIWICGGAYMVVNRAVWLPEMLRFARAGYIVVSIEYRTSNETQFPDQLIDVKSAVRWLRAHAAEYCVDPERIFVMGESAGGTMASLLGVTAGMREFEQGDYLEYDSNVQGVVDFYGITDLADDCWDTSRSVPKWAMEAFLGTNYTPEQARKASAIRYVTPNAPPFLILHGTADPLIPISQSQRMYDALRQNGVDARYLEIVDASHGDDLFYQDAVVGRISDFLNEKAGR